MPLFLTYMFSDLDMLYVWKNWYYTLDKNLRRK